MATATNTTRPSKFNLSDIMKRAWAMYHDARHCGVAYIASGFKKNRFRNCLSIAWSEAKKAARPLSEQLEAAKLGHFMAQNSDDFYCTNGGFAAATRHIASLQAQIAAEGRVAA